MRLCICRHTPSASFPPTMWLHRLVFDFVLVLPHVLSKCVRAFAGTPTLHRFRLQCGCIVSFLAVFSHLPHALSKCVCAFAGTPPPYRFRLQCGCIVLYLAVLSNLPHALFIGVCAFSGTTPFASLLPMRWLPFVTPPCLQR